MSIDIKILGSTPISQIADSWNKAFSDYAVKIDMTEERLLSFFRQNSVRFDLSMGAFDGNRLVGLWMNGVRTIDGLLTAYDSGTAIWPEFRSMGISKQLAAKSNETLKKAGVGSYVLEVLAENDRAFNIYKKDGFEVTRNFICFQTTAPVSKIIKEMSDVEFRMGFIDEKIAAGLPKTEYMPSWQNQTESLLQIRGGIQVVTAWQNGNIIRFGTMQAERGRIPQIGFLPDRWNTELAPVLLAMLCNIVEPCKEIAVINVEDTAAKTIELLKRHGFTEMTRQYEMKKSLI